MNGRTAAPEEAETQAEVATIAPEGTVTSSPEGKREWVGRWREVKLYFVTYRVIYVVLAALGVATLVVNVYILNGWWPLVALDVFAADGTVLLASGVIYTIVIEVQRDLGRAARRD